ncbi:MAG: hypothetical protein QMD46_05855 [Methanomicrobiales archaeon]|nr:hypothetical protein [Methanomicrobiales archaeon]
MKISILIMVIAVICITLVSPTTALENLSERITNGHFDQVTRTYEQLLLDEELGIFSPPWPEGWSWTDEGYSFMYWEPDNWSAYHSVAMPRLAYFMMEKEEEYTLLLMLPEVNMWKSH